MTNISDFHRGKSHDRAMRWKVVREAVSKPIVFDAAFSLSSRDFFVSLRSKSNAYETCSLQRL